jgi:hypothetical protein
MRIATLALVAVIAGPVSAQTAPNAPSAVANPALATALAKLAADELELRKDLPNFTCRETATSRAMRKKMLVSEDRIVGNLRVQRNSRGRLTDHLEITELNGKPVTDSATYSKPVLVDGGFEEPLLYFLPAFQPCFQFALSGDRLDFSPASATRKLDACRSLGGPIGFAVLDQSGNLTHIERKVPPKYSQQAHVTEFTSNEVVPTELNGKIYPLGLKVVNDFVDNGLTRHFEATFSDCRYYTADIKILPGTTPLEDEPASPPPHP